jgi:hypothetical protein
MMLLVDPETREALPAKPAVVRDMDREYAVSHWRPGWRSGFKYEGNSPVSMWFAQCMDPCCDAFRCEPLPEPGEAW